MEEHHGASSTALAAISEDTRCRSAARSFPAHPRKASLLRDRPQFPQAGRPRRLFDRRARRLGGTWPTALDLRSEEHTSELQSLMRISYAVFCLKKKKQTKQLSSAQ